MENANLSNLIGQIRDKHLKGRSGPRVSDVFGSTKDFAIFLFPDTSEKLKCLERGK